MRFVTHYLHFANGCLLRNQSLNCISTEENLREAIANFITRKGFTVSFV